MQFHHIRPCPGACALSWGGRVTSGEFQDGGARLILLQVRGPGGGGGMRQVCAGKGWGCGAPVASTSMLSVYCRCRGCRRLLPDVPGETLHRFCRRGHVWARQQARRRRRGLGAPGEVEPRREDHNHAYRTHSPWGHLFHGSFRPSSLQTPNSVLRPNRPEPQSQFPTYSRIHFTERSVERNREQDVCSPFSDRKTGS